MHRVSTREILLNYTSVQDALNAICSVGNLARLGVGPSEIPFSDPEIELFLLWIKAGIGLSRLRFREKKRSKERNE
jgi:hypothetical protein